MVGRLMRLGLVALCLVSAVPIWQVPSRAHAEPRVALFEVKGMVCES